MDYRKLIITENPTLGQRFLRWVLWPLSVPYRLAAAGKNALYDTGAKSIYQSPLATFSIGNLSVGGTGKSPMVAWLAQYLRSHQLRVAILSRGYGELADGQNDEALELEQLLPDVPHLQHWDRVASAKLALEELDMQCLVLDDAFQHRRIGRHLDLVLLDATDPPRARRVLPAGLFREPLSSLRRADVVVLTRTSLADPKQLSRLESLVHRHSPDALVVRADHRPQGLWAYSPLGQALDSEQEAVSTLKDAKVLAFCGIGNPNSFFKTLENAGAEVLDRMAWPDHHAYSREDVERMSQWVRCHPSCEKVVCTMKDLVKLRIAELEAKPLRALRIAFAFQGNDEMRLKEKVDRVLRETAGTEANAAEEWTRES